MQASELSVVLKHLLPVPKRGGKKNKHTNWLEGVCVRLSRCFMTVADDLCTWCTVSEESSRHIKTGSVSALSPIDSKKHRQTDRERERSVQPDRQVSGQLDTWLNIADISRTGWLIRILIKLKTASHPVPLTSVEIHIYVDQPRLRSWLLDVWSVIMRPGSPASNQSVNHLDPGAGWRRHTHANCACTNNLYNCICAHPDPTTQGRQTHLLPRELKSTEQHKKTVKQSRTEQDVHGSKEHPETFLSPEKLSWCSSARRGSDYLG